MESRGVRVLAPSRPLALEGDSDSGLVVCSLVELCTISVTMTISLVHCSAPFIGRI